MSQNMNVLNQVGQIADPLASTLGDQPQAPMNLGKNGEQIVNELHGRYYLANYRNHVFMATASAIAIPVVASGVASLFCVNNPANSGKNLVLLTAAVGTVVATTVVDIAGVYYLTAPTNASTTVGTMKSGILGTGTPSVATFYSAVTHTSQTPILAGNIGGYGAVTDAGANFFMRDFNGQIIVPPNTCVDILMSTAAATASGAACELTWMEVPV